MKTKAIYSILALQMAVMGAGWASDFYVSPSGSDANAGTLEKPFQTIARAQSAVRSSADLRKKPITVHIREGTYYLDKSIEFTPEDSGAPGAEVSYIAHKGEKVVISGGSKLALEWAPYERGILQAKTPEGVTMDQLFVNGKRQHMARYPNYDPNVFPYNGYAEDAISNERVTNWKDPAGGFFHALHQAGWGGFHWEITGKGPKGLVMKGGNQNNRSSRPHRNKQFVENIFEELDVAGEWFHNTKTSTLYFYPPQGVDVKTATFEIARLERLFEFKGSKASPVRHINLSGLVMRHTLRTFMKTGEPLMRSDWKIHRGGAIFLSGAEDVLIVDCELDQLGGNAIMVCDYNRRVTVRGAYIHGSGASGVCFIGSKDSVFNPLSNYNVSMSYEQIDKTPGPKTDDYPGDCVVEDSLMHDIGVVEKQVAGVQVSRSRGITIRHCSIYDTARAGINFSEGAHGGHVIEFCDVFDTVRETADHGSFNSWGRDRFWKLKNVPDGELPKLALLDTEKIIIRNSRWRCDHGWDIDLDDGSSNYEIYNNVMLNGGLKLREGFHRTVYNNICVGGNLDNHMWYPASNDVVKHNIWMKPHEWVKCGGRGKEIDYNLFGFAGDSKNGSSDVDQNSVWGDPMFVDAEKGDYRVKDGSPALKVGFKNFPMDQFGVQKPELKKIARQPEFPGIGSDGVAEPASPAIVENWLGAKVAAISGDEFSAFGVSKEDGGIHLIKVAAGSPAAKAGFKDGDLVQRINGQKVSFMPEFQKVAASGAGKPMKVVFVREQAEMTLTLNP